MQNNKKSLRKLQEETQLKIYKVMSVPTLIYCSESWLLKEKRYVESAGIRLLQTVKGCTYKFIKNTQCNHNRKLKDSAITKIL